MGLNSQLKKYLAILLCGCLPYGFVIGETLGNAWPTDSALFHTGDLKGADDLWKDAFEEGAKRWNDTPTSFQFLTERTSGTGFCSSFGNNSVQFSSTSCGDTWGSTTLAITRTWSSGSTTNKSDIIFNTNHDWDVYDGADRFFVNDFRRVAIHEMGHSAGLAHPIATDVIMSASSNDAYLPALDDVNSLRGIYGRTTHTLTLENLGDGVITVTPLVDRTGVVSDDIFYTSNYGSFLDCNATLCQIPIQDGLRLTIEAHPSASNGVEFINWSGTTIQSSSVELAPFVGDRTLTAHYSIGFDADEDGVADNVDNCPLVANAKQVNADGDNAGDACDALPNDPTETLDSDNEGIGDRTDNCPDIANFNQRNADGDRQGNSCDPDDDNDGVTDKVDAFPLDAKESIDTDSDGIGNNSDADDDNDSVKDDVDAFPLDATESVDTDRDGIGNNADADDDNDGVTDKVDAFPLDAAESIDTDSDGIGNNADLDDDNDGIPDGVDNFPLAASESIDTDGDGTGNNADTDDDNDGIPDGADNFPLDASESIDTDGDGIGNNADLDDDNDGIPDGVDSFPLDASESVDSDGDGIGNNADLDDDNDGIPDGDDPLPLDPAKSDVTSGNDSNEGGGAVSFLVLGLFGLSGIFRRKVNTHS